MKVSREMKQNTANELNSCSSTASLPSTIPAADIGTSSKRLRLLNMSEDETSLNSDLCASISQYLFQMKV